MSSQREFNCWLCGAALWAPHRPGCKRACPRIKDDSVRPVDLVQADYLAWKHA